MKNQRIVLTPPPHPIVPGPSLYLVSERVKAMDGWQDQGQEYGDGKVVCSIKFRLIN